MNDESLEESTNGIAIIGMAGRFPGARSTREFWQNLRVPGASNTLNQNLEHAGRVADFLEFAQLFATDALHRSESCGGHSGAGEPQVR